MIVTVGSINADQIAAVGEFPKPGETIMSTGFALRAGGKGANQALAARRAGEEVLLVGCLGDDPNAATVLNNLELAGVCTNRIARLAGEVTGTALITVDSGGENSIIVVPGANSQLTPKLVHEGLAHAPAGSLVILQQELPGPTIEACFSAAAEMGLKTCLNVAPFRSELIHLAGRADYLICNLLEFNALAGGVTEASVMEKAVEWSRQHSQIIIVTLGGNGAAVATPETSFHVPEIEVNVRDTVGAGDCFCGYFAAAVSRGWSLRDAVELAVAASGMACETIGAQESVPSIAEVTTRMTGRTSELNANRLSFSGREGGLLTASGNVVQIK